VRGGSRGGERRRIEAGFSLETVHQGGIIWVPILLGELRTKEGWGPQKVRGGDGGGGGHREKIEKQFQPYIGPGRGPPGTRIWRGKGRLAIGDTKNKKEVSFLIQRSTKKDLSLGGLYILNIGRLGPAGEGKFGGGVSKKEGGKRHIFQTAGIFRTGSEGEVGSRKQRVVVNPTNKCWQEAGKKFKTVYLVTTVNNG